MSDFPQSESPTIPSRSPRTVPRVVADFAKQINEGRYERGREIGHGGMGKILEAVDKPLRRSVALKVLVRLGDEESQKRFIREARITGDLQHPSIVPVHELNVDEKGELFYTMKLVRGVTLLDILQNLARRDPETLRRYSLSSLLTIFQKVCDAVAFAHSQPEPIIHRDLKPENIMVGDYGEVLVMDWGAAKILYSKAVPDESPSSAESSETATNGEMTTDMFVTQAGSVMGTPGYMAPEQARGDAASTNERTDIYSLGAILYALLTLEAPIRLTRAEAEDFAKRSQDGKNSTDEFHRHVAPLLSDRSARQKLARPVPDSLVHVILKAMALRPDDRYASVKKLQADVAAYQSGRATSAEEALPWKRFKLLVARNKVLFSAIATVLAVLLAATVVSLEQRKVALKSNAGLQSALYRASFADHESARQRFSAGAWREGVALMGRSLAFWPENRAAADYLLSAIIFGRGDRDRLPIFGVRHDGAINLAAFSPDGRYFATASYDHTTRIWNATTGAQIGKTLNLTGPCTTADFSPDGRKLLTVGEDGLVMLWDVQTGEALVRPMRHGRPDLDVLSVVAGGVFSSDGKQILTASFDHTARVWDAASGTEIAQLVNPHRVADAVFSPDGTRILTCYWYGGAMLWDATSFQPIGSPMSHGATVRNAKFTPDGNKIVTCSLDKTARVWDGHTAKPLTPPLKHRDIVWTLAISPDGKTFATACYDKTARLWSLTDGSPVGIPMEHNGPVNTVAFSPDGKRLVTAGRDKTVRLWDTQTCKPIGTPMRHDETVLGAIFNADASKVLSFGWDNAAYLWDAEPPAWPGEIIPVPGEVRSIEFDGNDDRVFLATRNGQAGLWSLSKKNFVTPIADHGGEISAAAFQPVTKQFATAGTDGVVRFWNAKNGSKVGETKAEKDSVVALAFSVDGSSLFAAYLGGSVLQWKIPEGTQVGNVMKHSEKMDALAVSPSGKELATGCRNDYVHFWETPSGNALSRTIRHTNPVHAISFHPNGRLLATGCDDHSARIWSLDSGDQLGEPFWLNGRATAVRYTDRGNALLVGGIEDTEVNCYDTTTRRSLFLPLPHPEGVTHVAANADGSLIVTVATDGIGRLWRIPSASIPPPRWLRDYLSALSGTMFSTEQQFTQVPTAERLRLRRKLLENVGASSVWETVMRRSFQLDAAHLAER